MNSGSQVDSGDLAHRLKSRIRDVADFPKPGVIFKDITPVLADSALFREALEAMMTPFAGSGVTHVVGIESRGFIFGAPMAIGLNAAFVPMRKRGKLPHRTSVMEYELEYGTDHLEIHTDACDPSARVLIVDDVLATGGTASAACRLVESVDAVVVGVSVLIELSFLPWRSALAGRRAAALVTY